MASLIRVAVIHPHPIFLKGIEQEIKRCEGLELVAAAAKVEEMECVLHQKQVDVLIVENSIAGIEVILEPAQRPSGCRVVVLTPLDDPPKALAVGAHGYILEGASGPELVAAVKKVHDGRRFVTPELANHIAVELLLEVGERTRSPIGGTSKQEPLSHRERQILQHLSKGLPNQEIADLLGLSLGTVKHYVTHLFKKMRVRNRVEAIQASRKV
jgi:DNA-binding NarL/FixJ family response regulator